jgi:hypothetical protein
MPIHFSPPDPHTVIGNQHVTGNVQIDGSDFVQGQFVANTGANNSVNRVLNILGHDLGLAGTNPPSLDFPWFIQFGTNVYTFVAGNATLTYPTPFPNGVFLFLCINGDQGSGNILIEPNLGINSLSAIAMHAFLANTGAAVSGGLRVNWIAI